SEACHFYQVRVLVPLLSRVTAEKDTAPDDLCHLSRGADFFQMVRWILPADPPAGLFLFYTKHRFGILAEIHPHYAGWARRRYAFRPRSRYSEAWKACPGG